MSWSRAGSLSLSQEGSAAAAPSLLLLRLLLLGRSATAGAAAFGPRRREIGGFSVPPPDVAIGAAPDAAAPDAATGAATGAPRRGSLPPALLRSGSASFLPALASARFFAAAPLRANGGGRVEASPLLPLPLSPPSTGSGSLSGDLWSCKASRGDCGAGAASFRRPARANGGFRPPPPLASASATGAGSTAASRVPFLRRCSGGGSDGPRGADSDSFTRAGETPRRLAAGSPRSTPPPEEARCGDGGEPAPAPSLRE